MSLVACPFCREMFDVAEVSSCPICAMQVKPLAELPLSYEAAHGEGLVAQPDLEPMPLRSMERGRGIVLAACVVGAAFFFAPWVVHTFPIQKTLSGYELARRLGWPWGAAAAWFVLVPTVMSRRSIAGMRGARVAVSFLSAVPIITAAVLMLARPTQSAWYVTRYSYGWGLYGMLIAALVAFVVALRFGGKATPAQSSAVPRPISDALH